MADLRRWKRRIRARRATVIVVTVVLVGGGAAVAWAATRPASTAYRTAFAGPASVTDSLAAIGTLQPVSQATVAFPMSGQVASVGVQVGSSVVAGQTLAVLNTTGLATTVSSDQSAVATAQAKLAADQTSQTTVPASQTTTPSASTGSSSRSGSSSSSKLTTLLQGLAADQNAVRKAQQQVDADLVLVTAVDKQLAATCPAVVQSLTGAQSKPTDPPATSDTTAPPATSVTPTPPPVDVTGCTDLINQASADEAKTATDERGLSTSVATLSTALNQVVAAVGQTATTPAPSTPAPSSSGGSSGSRSGTSGSGSSGPASANQIAADQAAVDAANAQLAAAQQNLAAATLVSPIAGTVADVTMTAGQNASANSTTAHIMVVGPGEDEVMTAVNDTSVGQVKPGQPATITPDGVTKPIAGKVTSIGALGSTTSGGSASYPVTITLDPTSQPLFNGATASVAITLGTAQAPVTVPTSAVQTLGPFSIVSKMVNGKPTTTRVTLGVVGATVTQITSGLKAGDEVMLANITEPMPTSGNTNARAFVGGRAAFAGGGGAGFAGGGGGGAGGGGAGGGGGAAGAGGAAKGAPAGGG